MARGKMGPCKACPTCDGRGCRSTIPGPGAKGSGDVAIRNHDAWQGYRLDMDTLHPSFDPSCATKVLGFDLSLPVMVGPVGDVRRHYGDLMDDLSYNDCVLKAAADGGTVAFTGDGLNADVMRNATSLISQLDGRGIPTIKPWSLDVVSEKLELVHEAHPVAVAMDIDAAGLPFLKGQEPPAGPKSVHELASIIDDCDEPFIVKGIMTPTAAEKAVDAGADAIVVSNHGGRVLDGVPSTAEMLPSIVDAVADDVTIFVDGGIRSGIDVFRALALGADACLIARPFVVATYGAGEEGVRSYLSQLEGELLDTMLMCGTADIAEICEDKLFW
ncbi:MAG: alpha-hydroxy-acid oxidizing protein [Atopobiaceae bacterium]|nr:alpha-hydroxy-acid oxidizing protein [Atopobiaceae bacterium]